jgi:type 1 glutamine amidotransferase
MVPEVRAAAPLRVLYFTLSSGYRHEVIPESERILRALGERDGRFEVTVSQDPAMLRARALADYDVLVFYTTGELPIDAGQKADLLAFVAGGRGFVGVHSAADTFYRWPAYGRMLGGYFDQHPWHEEVTVRVEDRTHPATHHLPPAFGIHDEIYLFKDWSRDNVRVLLSLDTASVDLRAPHVHRTDGDFALAWTREYGKGRVFYTALGHRREVWRDARFQRMLVEAVVWAGQPPRSP